MERDSRKENVNKGYFSREHFIKELQNDSVLWDIIVIGGGATGLGVALDAASRGFKTLLLEQADFAKGTSSRSTKLVHGGVRYLAQGNIRLVYEALFERGLLLKNAPHLVSAQPFVIPVYSWWSKMFYGTGLKIYDWLAGRYRLHETSLLSKERVMELLPNVRQKDLVGGVMYYDGQFDDARLAINIAQTCAEKGGVLINYMKVTALLKDETGKLTGLQTQDVESGRVYKIKAKVIINATGVFVNEVLHMDAPAQPPLIRPSQGVHVVLDRSFLGSNNALMLPKTPDGRVLFAVPWYGRLVVGTTDTPLKEYSLEPAALEQEIDFILETAGRYLLQKPGRGDVLSVFAGLRPLAAPDNLTDSTKEISRSHKLLVSASGLLTITGGKWTTYRKMAEDTVDKAIKIGGLPSKPCVTASLKIHGALSTHQSAGHWAVYGTDAAKIKVLQQQAPELEQLLHDKFPNTGAEVVWAVRYEMSRTLEDVLARRLRVLFLDARAAVEMAPKVAALMASELGYNTLWQQQQIEAFTSLASKYLLQPFSIDKNKLSDPIA